MAKARRERRRAAALAFGAAVVFRVALFFSGLVPDTYETGDSPEYRRLAESLLRHQVFGWDGVPKMNRTPGYPAFLALVFATIGRSQVAVTAAQIAVDALTCAMIVDLALRLRLAKRGVIAAGVACVTCIFTSVLSYQLMTETLYTFGIVAAVWVLPVGPVSAILHPANRWRVALSGLAIGCTALVRPLEAFTAAGFLAIVGVLLVRRIGIRRVISKRVIVPAVIFGVCASAALVPWMARNRIVFAWEYEKPNHDHVTLLGYKTDSFVFRHWYTKEFTYWRTSYEEPMVMIAPYEPPTVARFVYPGEKEEVEAAFATLKPTVTESFTEPVSRETLDAFESIGKKRYAAAPRLHVSAPLSRLVKLWVAPRVSIAFTSKNGGNVPLHTTVLFTLYDLAYVGPGLLGLLLGLRRGRVVQAAIVATLIGHSVLYAFVHAAPNSRYAVPMFPLLSLGLGACWKAWRLRRRVLGSAPP
jgi:hypothetical protein